MKLLDPILTFFPPEMTQPLWADAAGWEYREPFFGAGAVGLEIVEKLPVRCSAWLNDLDYDLVCLWKSVKESPRELCEEIYRFEPAAEFFARFKADQGKNTGRDPVRVGFEKLALHQMSFGGFGGKSGGPLGGKKQNNAKYGVGCRWSPERLVADVWEFHAILSRRNVKITCRDFSELFDGNPKAFIYCDPPYYAQGPALYLHPFTDADHRRLRDCCFAHPGGWAVSYDEHPFIRDLYDGRSFRSLDVTYSCAIERGSRRKNKEVLIG